MRVVIVVLSFNSLKYIGKCLDSLKKLKTLADLETVVIDSGSTDNSVRYLQERYPSITLITNNKNLGYAAGNNLGLRYALKHDADFIWIVNPDVIVAPPALETALKAFTDPSVGVVASKVYFAKGFEFHKDRYSAEDLGHVIWYAGGKMDWDNVQTLHLGVNEVDRGQYDTAGETGFVTGASMLLRGSMLANVGFLDENYFLYFEESDLCMRARNKEWKLWYEPKSVVWHANAQATGAGSSLVDYYTTRNRLLFGLCWAPWRAKFALFRESLRLLVSGRTWQRRGVRDFYLGRLGKGTYA